ncbi:MAG: ribbon-helix-helix protein, CopG family [Acidobacteriota bacterium]
MRISARLDATSAHKLSDLSRRTGYGTTEIVKRAIDLYYAQEKASRESAADILRAVGFVGSGAASPDLSSNYKEELGALIGKKHDPR